jgi:hypothetical protein
MARSPAAPAPSAAALPWQLRVARVAEMLYLPVGAFILAGVPRTDYLTFVLVLFQVAMAVVVIVRLKQRSRHAWVAAMLLAAYILIGVVLRAPSLLRSAGAGRWAAPSVVAVTLVGWVALTQVAVLASCLALREWRAELR